MSALGTAASDNPRTTAGLHAAIVTFYRGSPEKIIVNRGSWGKPSAAVFSELPLPRVLLL